MGAGKFLATVAGNWAQAQKLYGRGYGLRLVLADGTALAGLAAAPSPSSATNTRKAEVVMPVQTVDLDVRDARLMGIVAPDALLEPLATGFEFLEGPVWLPAERALIFSDIPGDAMYRWDAAGGAVVFRQPSHKANGNTLDGQGRILTCKHATSRVVRQEPDGRLTVLASHYAGVELNSPNDIVVKRDGAIYFTDPNFGRRPTRHGVPRAQDNRFQGCSGWTLRRGSLRRLADDFDQPNGLCFSLDETRLFVNDSPRGHIRVFDVQADGTLRVAKCGLS